MAGHPTKNVRDSTMTPRLNNLLEQVIELRKVQALDSERMPTEVAKERCIGPESIPHMKLLGPLDGFTLPVSPVAMNTKYHHPGNSAQGPCPEFN